MLEFTESDFASIYSILEQDHPDKEPMYYCLNIYGVWCKGKHARCYAGERFACSKCDFYDGRGSN